MTRQLLRQLLVWLIVLGASLLLFVAVALYKYQQFNVYQQRHAVLHRHIEELGENLKNAKSDFAQLSGQQQKLLQYLQQGLLDAPRRQEWLLELQRHAHQLQLMSFRSNVTAQQLVHAGPYSWLQSKQQLHISAQDELRLLNMLSANLELGGLISIDDCKFTSNGNTSEPQISANCNLQWLSASSAPPIEELAYE